MVITNFIHAQFISNEIYMENLQIAIENFIVTRVTFISISLSFRRFTAENDKNKSKSIETKLKDVIMVISRRLLFLDLRGQWNLNSDLRKWQRRNILTSKLSEFQFVFKISRSIFLTLFRFNSFSTACSGCFINWTRKRTTENGQQAMNVFAVTKRFTIDKSIRFQFSFWRLPFFFFVSV